MRRKEAKLEIGKEPITTSTSESGVGLEQDFVGITDRVWERKITSSGTGAGGVR